MTWTQAKRECRALGFTLKATGFGQEHALYLTGTRNAMDDLATYFTTCPNDAYESARAWRQSMDGYRNAETEGDYYGE